MYSKMFRASVLKMRQAQKRYERARLVSCGRELQEAEEAASEAEADIDEELKPDVENEKLRIKFLRMQLYPRLKQ